MGYELRREIREALGPNVTGLQRAVALEIADDARHDADGRRSRVSLRDLARWTGAKDTAVVRNALKRLAEAGWEFRVPIGKGKDGRVLYAVPGHSMEFRVPHPPEGAGATPPSQTTTHITTTSADAADDESARSDEQTQQQDESTAAAAKKPTKKTSRKTSAKKAGEHPVADELADAFWKRHGKGRAQSFIAVRSVVRTAIGNGVERNELAHALERLVLDGMSVSGSTIDIALSKIRRPGPRQSGPPTAPRHMTEEEKQDALNF